MATRRAVGVSVAPVREVWVAGVDGTGLPVTASSNLIEDGNAVAVGQLRNATGLRTSTGVVEERWEWFPPDEIRASGVAPIETRAVGGEALPGDVEETVFGRWRIER